jgi:hypothetical protein
MLYLVLVWIIKNLIRMDNGFYPDSSGYYPDKNHKNFKTLIY